MKSTLITFLFFAIASSAPVRRQAGNVQTFTSALGGIAATPVEDSGNPDRPFQVKGDTFANINAALARSCDQQFNACANAANGGNASLTVAQCSTQKDQCSASIQASTAAQGISQGGGADGANNGNTSETDAGNADGGTGNGTNATGCT